MPCMSHGSEVACAKTMNWYINNAGAAEGPKDDDTMAELFRSKKLSLESIVWHSGLDAWQPLSQISPTWLGGNSTPTAKAKNDDGKKRPDARRLAGPKAPTTAPAEPKPTGLLKRLFGLAKKKD